MLFCSKPIKSVPYTYSDIIFCHGFCPHDFRNVSEDLFCGTGEDDYINVSLIFIDYQFALPQSSPVLSVWLL